MSSLSIANSRTPESSVTRCRVCGFTEVRTDEVAELNLMLAECPRCDHRWTGRFPVAPRLVRVRALGIAETQSGLAGGATGLAGGATGLARAATGLAGAATAA